MSIKSMNAQVNKQIGALAHALPDQVRAFQDLVAATSAPGELETATKELMALSVAIVTQCDGCIAFHLEKAVKNGATEAAIIETLAVAMEMGGGPATIYSAKTWQMYQEDFS